MYSKMLKNVRLSVYIVISYASCCKKIGKRVVLRLFQFQMTPEETEKRQHRRELNRVAARKCRNKRKLEHASVETVSCIKYTVLYCLNQASMLLLLLWYST